MEKLIVAFSDLRKPEMLYNVWRLVATVIQSQVEITESISSSSFVMVCDHGSHEYCIMDCLIIVSA